MNRQKLVLAILLILLLSALVWSYHSWPRQKSVSILKFPPGGYAQAERKRLPAAEKSAAAQNVLRLDLLEKEQPNFNGYHRNIFRPLFVDEQKLMRQKAAAVKLVPPAKPPPVAVPVTPRQELARFNYLGFVSKDNRKTIFLTKDNEIILVRKGDVISGRYEATSLTDETLTILVRDTGEEIVTQLLENRALGAVK